MSYRDLVAHGPFIPSLVSDDPGQSSCDLGRRPRVTGVDPVAEPLVLFISYHSYVRNIIIYL